MEDDGCSATHVRHMADMADVLLEVAPLVRMLPLPFSSLSQVVEHLTTKSIGLSTCNCWTCPN